MKKYSLAFLQALSTLKSGQFSDLKIDTPFLRVWLSRLTREDGETCDNPVIIEVRNFETGEWDKVAEYPAIRRKKSDGRLLVKLDVGSRYFGDFFSGTKWVSCTRNGSLMRRLETYPTEKLANRTASEMNGAVYQFCKDNGMDWLYHKSLPDELK